MSSGPTPPYVLVLDRASRKTRARWHACGPALAPSFVAYLFGLSDLRPPFLLDLARDDALKKPQPTHWENSLTVSLARMAGP